MSPGGEIAPIKNHRWLKVLFVFFLVPGLAWLHGLPARFFPGMGPGSFGRHVCPRAPVVTEAQVDWPESGPGS